MKKLLLQPYLNCPVKLYCQLLQKEKGEVMFIILPSFRKPEFNNYRRQLGANFQEGVNISWLLELRFWWLCFKFNIAIHKT